jgi:hypothetical protein
MADFNQLAHKVIEATVAATESAPEKPEPKIAEKKPDVPQGEKTGKHAEQR